MVFTNFFDAAKRNSSSTAPSQHAVASVASKKRGKKEHRRDDQSQETQHANNAPSKKRKKKRRPPKNLASASKRQRRTGPPSAEALALSATLKELSSQKRLKEALDIYWGSSNDEIRDGHHACIMVDCCARCGDMEQGEKVVNTLQASGMHINVETRTALLKGYAHSGMMYKGAVVFREMCLANSFRDRPNVRTLNTLLRGCLWTAASVSSNNASPSKVSGGVATSEEAWSLYRSSQSKGDGVSLVDSSSYEYAIVLLCQALQCDAVSTRINEMEQELDGDHTAMESLAVCMLSLARSYALLGRLGEAKTAAQNALDAVDRATFLLNKNGEKSGNKEECIGKMSGGGKRSWRPQRDKHTSQSHGSKVTRRTVSNSLFRTHRLSEIRSESTSILKVCEIDQPHLKPEQLAFFLLTRLLYFSGGGTTDLSTTRASRKANEISPKKTHVQLINSLWISFGLRAALEQSSHSIQLPNKKTLWEQDCKNICGAMGLGDALAVDAEGLIQFDRVFVLTDCQGNRRGNKRPLNIELGAGYGDWIVMQASCNPSEDYVAVELRSDRVSQTFSKAMLAVDGSPLPNLCCVGSECGAFLKSRVKKETVSNIYVNHPEPPTQTYGSQSTDLTEIANGLLEEPAHMLNSETLLSAAYCLKASGKLVVVTDNRWYARLICATIVKLMRRNDGLLRNVNLVGQRHGFNQIEVFPAHPDSAEMRNRVILYEGQPCTAIGHVMPKREIKGSSYFDRLWRSGAGSHAESKKRFIIAMERSHNGVGSPKGLISGTKSAVKDRKNRRRSEAKQRRRNERRLKKRSAET